MKQSLTILRNTNFNSLKFKHESSIRRVFYIYSTTICAAFFCILTYRFLLNLNMEAQLVESSTFPAQQYAQSFFASLPTDARFLQTSFQKIMPSSSIDGSTIEFNLDKYDAANLWQIQETYVEATVQILLANGELPPVTSKVSVVNNLLHSLFESVRLTINDYLISSSSKYYPYKSYISTVLTYPSTVKNAQLATKGWYEVHI